MARRKWRNYSPTFKAQVAVAALKGDKTLADLAQNFDAHFNQITDWKSRLQERAAEVFGGWLPPFIVPSRGGIAQEKRGQTR